MTSESELIAKLKAELAQAKAQLKQQNQLIRTQHEQLEKKEAQLSQKNAELKKKDTALEKKDAELEKKDAEIEKKDAEIEKKNAEIQLGQDRLQTVAMVAGVLIALCGSAIDAQLAQGPDPISDNARFKWLLERANEDFREVVENKSAAKLLKYVMSTGTEKLPEVKKIADEVSELDRDLKGSLGAVAAVNVSIAANQKRTENIADIVGQQAVSLAQAAAEAPSAVVSAAANIARARKDGTPASTSAAQSARQLAQAGAQAIQAAAKTKALQTAGRLVPQAKQDRRSLVEVKVRDKGLCPHCGKEHAFEYIMANEYFLRHLSSALNEILEETTFSCPVVKCGGCGTVFTDRPKEVPVPYSPAAGAQLDSKTVTSLAVLSAMGVPAHRTREILGTSQLDRLASEGFDRAVHAWLSESGIGGILVKAHVRAAREAGGVIVMDESPFSVLEAKGQGVKADGKSDSKSTYIGCITSPHYSRTPFAVYTLLASRSGQSIAKALREWTNIDTISIDGYAGYETALKLLGKENEIKVSRCLVHWRRTLFESLNLKDYEELAGPPEGKAEIRKRLESGEADVSFISVIGALGKIYAHEGSIVRKSDEDDAAYLDRILQMRRTKVKPLIEEIDQLMNDLGARYAKKGRKGWEAAEASPYAKGVVYWLNHREDLCRFLDDARLSPDTNAVERCMRAVAVARRSSFFKQTKAYMGTQCSAWTLRETAKMNGIKDAAAWLNDFHRAYFEHCERMILTARNESRRPGKGDKLALRIPRITAEMISSFDFRPWLAWNYAAKLPAGEKIQPM